MPAGTPPRKVQGGSEAREESVRPPANARAPTASYHQPNDGRRGTVVVDLMSDVVRFRAVSVLVSVLLYVLIVRGMFTPSSSPAPSLQRLEWASSLPAAALVGEALTREPRVVALDASDIGLAGVSVTLRLRSVFPVAGGGGPAGAGGGGQASAAAFSCSDSDASASAEGRSGSDTAPAVTVHDMLTRDLCRAALSGATATTDKLGVARFPGLRIEGPPGQYVLHAAAADARTRRSVSSDTGRVSVASAVVALEPLNAPSHAASIRVGEALALGPRVRVLGTAGALEGRRVFAFAGPAPTWGGATTTAHPEGGGFAALAIRSGGAGAAAGDASISEAVASVTTDAAGVALFDDLSVEVATRRNVYVHFFCEGVVATWHSGVGAAAGGARTALRGAGDGVARQLPAIPTYITPLRIVPRVASVDVTTPPSPSVKEGSTMARQPVITVKDAAGTGLAGVVCVAEFASRPAAPHVAVSALDDLSAPVPQPTRVPLALTQAYDVETVVSVEGGGAAAAAAPRRLAATFKGLTGAVSARSDAQGVAKFKSLGVDTRGAAGTYTVRFLCEGAANSAADDATVAVESVIEAVQIVRAPVTLPVRGEALSAFESEGSRPALVRIVGAQGKGIAGKAVVARLVSATTTPTEVTTAMVPPSVAGVGVDTLFLGQGAASSAVTDADGFASLPVFFTHANRTLLSAVAGGARLEFVADGAHSGPTDLPVEPSRVVVDLDSCTQLRLESHSVAAVAALGPLETGDVLPGPFVLRAVNSRGHGVGGLFVAGYSDQGHLATEATLYDVLALDPYAPGAMAPTAAFNTTEAVTGSVVLQSLVVARGPSDGTMQLRFGAFRSQSAALAAGGGGGGGSGAECLSEAIPIAVRNTVARVEVDFGAAQRTPATPGAAASGAGAPRNAVDAVMGSPLHGLIKVKKADGSAYGGSALAPVLCTAVLVHVPPYLPVLDPAARSLSPVPGAGIARRRGAGGAGGAGAGVVVDPSALRADSDFDSDFGGSAAFWTPNEDPLALGDNADGGPPPSHVELTSLALNVSTNATHAATGAASVSITPVPGYPGRFGLVFDCDGVQSEPQFFIVPNPAATLAIITQPAAGGGANARVAIGDLLPTQPVVEVRDKNNAPLRGFRVLARWVNEDAAAPVGGAKPAPAAFAPAMADVSAAVWGTTLGTGTSAPSQANGRAAFSSLMAIDAVPGCYRLQFFVGDDGDAGLSQDVLSAPSDKVCLRSARTRLSVAREPSSSTTLGRAVATAPQVRIQARGAASDAASRGIFVVAVAPAAYESVPARVREPGPLHPATAASFASRLLDGWVCVYAGSGPAVSGGCGAMQVSAAAHGQWQEYRASFDALRWVAGAGGDRMTLQFMPAIALEDPWSAAAGAMAVQGEDGAGTTAASQPTRPVSLAKQPCSLVVTSQPRGLVATGGLVEIGVHASLDGGGTLPFTRIFAELVPSSGGASEAALASVMGGVVDADNAAAGVGAPPAEALGPTGKGGRSIDLEAARGPNAVALAPSAEASLLSMPAWLSPLQVSALTDADGDARLALRVQGGRGGNYSVVLRTSATTGVAAGATTSDAFVVSNPVVSVLPTSDDSRTLQGTENAAAADAGGDDRPDAVDAGLPVIAPMAPRVKVTDAAGAAVPGLEQASRWRVRVVHEATPEERARKLARSVTDRSSFDDDSADTAADVAGETWGLLVSGAAKVGLRPLEFAAADATVERAPLFDRGRDEYVLEGLSIAFHEVGRFQLVFYVDGIASAASQTVIEIASQDDEPDAGRRAAAAAVKAVVCLVVVAIYLGNSAWRDVGWWVAVGILADVAAIGGYVALYIAGIDRRDRGDRGGMGWHILFLGDAVLVLMALLVVCVRRRRGQNGSADGKSDGFITSQRDAAYEEYVRRFFGPRRRYAGAWAPAQPAHDELAATLSAAERSSVASSAAAGGAASSVGASDDALDLDGEAGSLTASDGFDAFEKARAPPFAEVVVMSSGAIMRVRADRAPPSLDARVEAARKRAARAAKHRDWRTQARLAVQSARAQAQAGYSTPRSTAGATAATDPSAFFYPGRLFVAVALSFVSIVAVFFASLSTLQHLRYRIHNLDAASRLAMFTGLRNLEALFLAQTASDLSTSDEEWLYDQAAQLRARTLEATDALIGAFVVGVLLATVGYVTSWVLLLTDFRVRVLDARVGRFEVAQVEVRTADASDFAGLAVANSIVAFAVNVAMVTFVILPFAWPVTRDLIFSHWPLYLALLLPWLFDEVLSWLVARRMFNERDLVQQRTLFAWWDWYKVFARTYTGLVSAILRFASVMLVGLIALPRVDKSPLPAWAEARGRRGFGGGGELAGAGGGGLGAPNPRDRPARSYMALVKMHHAAHNPIAVLAARILAHGPVDRAAGRALPVPMRRAYNRWQLAWMLFKHPSLLKYRVRRPPESSNAWFVVPATPGRDGHGGSDIHGSTRRAGGEATGGDTHDAADEAGASVPHTPRDPHVAAAVDTIVGDDASERERKRLLDELEADRRRMAEALSAERRRQEDELKRRLDARASAKQRRERQRKDAEEAARAAAAEAARLEALKAQQEREREEAKRAADEEDARERQRDGVSNGDDGGGGGKGDDGTGASDSKAAFDAEAELRRLRSQHEHELDALHARTDAEQRRQRAALDAKLEARRRKREEAARRRHRDAETDPAASRALEAELVSVAEQEAAKAVEETAALDETFDKLAADAESERARLVAEHEREVAALREREAAERARQQAALKARLEERKRAKAEALARAKQAEGVDATAAAASAAEEAAREVAEEDKAAEAAATASARAFDAEAELTRIRDQHDKEAAQLEASRRAERRRQRAALEERLRAKRAAAATSPLAAGGGSTPRPGDDEAAVAARKALLAQEAAARKALEDEALSAAHKERLASQASQAELEAQLRKIREAHDAEVDAVLDAKTGERRRQRAATEARIAARRRKRELALQRRQEAELTDAAVAAAAKAGESAAEAEAASAAEAAAASEDAAAGPSDGVVAEVEAAAAELGGDAAADASAAAAEAKAAEELRAFEAAQEEGAAKALAEAQAKAQEELEREAMAAEAKRRALIDERREAAAARLKAANDSKATAMELERVKAENEKELQALEQRQADERRRQQAGLSKRLEARKARQERALKRKQAEAVRGKASSLQAEAAQAKAAAQAALEKKAIAALLAKRGGGSGAAAGAPAGDAASAAIDAVMRERHQREMADLLGAQYEARNAALAEALEDVFDAKHEAMTDLVQSLNAASGGSKSGEREKAIGELNARFRRMQKDREHEVLAQLEAHHAQAQLELRRRQLAEISAAYQELTPPEVAARHAAEAQQREAEELQEVQAELEREKAERIARIRDEKRRLQEELTRETEAEIARIEMEAEEALRKQREAAEASLAKRREQMLAAQKAEHERRLAEAGEMTEAVRKQVMDEFEGERARLENKIKAEKNRQRENVQAKLARRRAARKREMERRLHERLEAEDSSAVEREKTVNAAFDAQKVKLMADVFLVFNKWQRKSLNKERA